MLPDIFRIFHFSYFSFFSPQISSLWKMVDQKLTKFPSSPVVLDFITVFQWLMSVFIPEKSLIGDPYGLWAQAKPQGRA